jgi:hypothetical protein
VFVGWAEAVPKREEFLHTPAVFVRVASKGVAGYGTWKCVRRMEGRNGKWKSENGK